MPEIDDETLARALQWCAEAGRRASPAEVRAALSGLSWDALLAARAVLADEPPARPLGPFALADIARGVPPEAAAERERSGGYARDAGGPSRVDDDRGGEPGASADAASRPATPVRKTRRGAGTRRVATVVIRRARDRQPDEAPPAERAPLVDELFASEGRSVLERWIRRHGARRARLTEELSRWQRPDGTGAGEDDLTRLLDVHGLTRAFERRERAEVLHAVRAAGGRLGAAAGALGIPRHALDDVATRLRIGGEIEGIREERRDEIRRRGTLGDRVRLLVDEAQRIEDLGMTTELEADVRDRLHEHLRALRAAHARNATSSFARTLGITREQAEAIAARFGLDLSEGGAAPARPHRAGGAPARPPGRGERPAHARGTGRPERDRGPSRTSAGRRFGGRGGGSAGRDERPAQRDRAGGRDERPGQRDRAGGRGARPSGRERPEARGRPQTHGGVAPAPRAGSRPGQPRPTPPGRGRPRPGGRPPRR